MAISITHLTSGQGSGAGAVSTASVNPAAQSMVLLAFAFYGNGVDPSGVSGLGLTWTLVQKMLDTNGNASYLYRGNGTVSNGPITISGSGTVYAAWSVEQVTGHNDSSPIVQIVTSDGAPATSVTMTLAALASPANAAFGCSSMNANLSPSAGTGFTLLGGNNWNADIGLQENTEYAINQTSVTLSWPSPGGAPGGIAVEIAAGAAAVAAAGRATTLLGVS